MSEPRRRLTKEERARQIALVAARHFKRDGAAGASVSAIAKEAGVARALVYQHFPDKEALLSAAARIESETLFTITADVEGLSPHENASRAVRAFFGEYRVNSADARSLYRDNSDLPPFLAQVARESISAQLSRLHTITGAPDDEVTRAALAAWLAFVESMARSVVAAPEVELDAAAEVCVGALEGALGYRLDERGA